MSSLLHSVVATTGIDKCASTRAFRDDVWQAKTDRVRCTKWHGRPKKVWPQGLEVHHQLVALAWLSNTTCLCSIAFPQDLL